MPSLWARRRSLYSDSFRLRYTGVEFDEAAIVPRPPSETLRRKYGDCKDQAALLVAMLRAAGVPARVALLRAGEGPDVDPDLPGLGVFDHAIVRVAGEPPLWIDPTDPYAASGDLPTPDQGRLALEAAPGTTGLQKTPESAAADNRTLETREFFLAEEGEARVVETTEVWGAPERNYRRYYAEVDRDKIKKGLEEYVKGRYRAKKLEKYEATDPSNVAIPFRLTLEATGAARGTTSGGEAAVAIEPGPITAELPEEIADAGEKEEPRVNDLFLPKPFRTEWHYRIVPPPGEEPVGGEEPGPREAFEELRGRRGRHHHRGPALRDSQTQAEPRRGAGAAEKRPRAEEGEADPADLRRDRGSASRGRPDQGGAGRVQPPGGAAPEGGAASHRHRAGPPGRRHG